MEKGVGGPGAVIAWGLLLAGIRDGIRCAPGRNLSAKKWTSGSDKTALGFCVRTKNLRERRRGGEDERVSMGLGWGPNHLAGVKSSFKVNAAFGRCG